MLTSRASIRALTVLLQQYSPSRCFGNSAISRFYTLSSAPHENAAVYLHSDCLKFASNQRKLNFSTTTVRSLQILKNPGEKHTYIKRPWTLSVEENEVSDRIRELQDCYGNDATKTFAGNNSRIGQKEHPRKRVGFGEETNILVDIVLKLKDSKEAVYGALDSWVAREETFPSNVLKRALYILEKKQQWHRIIQVIKWMLSKGQCTTMNTYEQLLRALENDHRAEEAHAFWEMRIGSNLQSVPWQLCIFMMCMYERNNMPERIIKLFNDLEMHNRKPPDKDAYELLGLEEEQQSVLENYRSLFKESSNYRYKKKKERKVQDGKGENAGNVLSFYLSQRLVMNSMSEIICLSCPHNFSCGRDSRI